MNSLQVLPFYNLNDQEFSLVNGIRSVQFSQLMDTDMFNPDKSDEIDPDLMLTIPMSNYYFTITTEILARSLANFYCQ